VANEEHVKRLKQGVAEWNAWRFENGVNEPDLSGADLFWANLIGAQLRGANLFGADLRSAQLSNAELNHAELKGGDLSHANLRYANLADADLSGANLNYAMLSSAILVVADLSAANLTSANLTNANLSGADLSSADLSSAKLGGTNLNRAMLRNANLSGAMLADTVFGNVDLTGAVGLETCDHRGPSIINHETFRKSGQLPPLFLRGLGLPDRLIDYLPSLFDQAIQYYSCFISYSAKDQDSAERLHADLQSKGVRCWFAPHDMPIGGKILDEIDIAIRLRDKVLLILSEHSIRSGWVEDEVTKAFEEERKRGQIVLFPLRIDDAVMDTNEAWAAKLRAQRHIGDFRHWKDHDGYKKSFERVLRDLKHSVGSEK
jgi:uncharacterized protein YjbI with pentapeptide repeats